MDDHEEIIKQTVSLIKIDSRNKPGAEDNITQYISRIFDDLKIKFKIIEHKNYRKSLITVLQGENSSKNLLVCGHLDTINPYAVLVDENKNIRTEVKDDKIFGLGSSDMKSGLTSIIFALKHLVENNIKPKYDIVAAFTGDEEAEKSGALHLLKMDFIKKTKIMLVSEPTGLNLGLGQKGQLWIELKFKGKPAHGSSPDKGKNAILMAINFINKVMDPQFFAKNTRFFTKSTINVGFVNAPGPFNVVQDTCIAGFDIRLSPPETIQEIMKKINSILFDEFKKSEYELKIIDSLDASYVNPEGKAAMQLKKIIDSHVSGRRKIALSYASDGSVLNTYLDIPVIIIGPGTPEVIHSKDEYVLIDNLIKSVDIYKDIFLNLDKIL